ncbi:hypothetical protein SAY86_029002 [Trapa natans]|uniref:WD repeat-containing protein 44 n=1 Tax=Trapa natans TaxID=22666 RepID=A0AAN7M0J3_TRANT|nr:hypothetical protein SAY86_029002 [Trapa natans]
MMTQDLMCWDSLRKIGMGDYHVEDDDERFFDAREVASSLSDWSSDSFHSCSSSPRDTDDILTVLRDEFWTRCPGSTRERRNQFLKRTNLNFDWILIGQEDSLPSYHDEIEVDNGRIASHSGAVLRDFDYSFSRVKSSCTKQEVELTCDDSRCGSSGARSGEIDNQIDIENGERQCRRHSRVEETLLNHSRSIDELRRVVGSYSPMVRPSFNGKLGHSKELGNPKQKMKVGWLRKIGVGACINGGGHVAITKPGDLELVAGMKMRKVQAHSHNKKHRELSSLYAGQEFLAHGGSISTMKFSADGRFLASSGDDAVVRVWKVTEEERLESVIISDLDNSCLYFAINESSELASLNVDKEQHLGKMRKIGRQSAPRCVILPKKVFHILEKPVHEFFGHSGEVLDLSWSKKGYLLSSSTDKTVRLWQVGCDKCLRVFSHNNYVTSVNFNPVDESFFISGSIDGKVRIWEVLNGRVVDYINMREIITAVTYQSDGKGAIVGTMSGNCCFYSIADSRLHFNNEICVQGGKKSMGKRITGFQFPPGDPSKVLVTSADSTVRILSGTNVTCKYKGHRSSGIHAMATFTSDGKHIVSANEDSGVCIWNYTDQKKTPSRAKSTSSCESFFSDGASIAIPWCAPLPSEQREDGHQTEADQASQTLDDYFDQKMPPFPSSPDCFTLGRGFLLELLPRASATWPEEKLSDSSPAMAYPTMCRSEYKFLKSALSDTPNMWGVVVVTAGWDGRIRTYHNYGLPVRS